MAIDQETFFENFALLADAPNGVQKLRELILQLAVRGKLVQQDPSDEPAAKLLERIRAEKARLVPGRGGSRTAQTMPVNTDEAPYDLPKGWVWVTLADASVRIHYGYTASADHGILDVRMLRITDIQNNNVDWDTVPGCEIDTDSVDSYRLLEGDLLIARTGGTIGKSYLVEGITVSAVFASYLIRVIPSQHLSAQYVKLFADSPLYWEQLYERSMGTGQPNVNGVSLSTLKLPLPPLPEQHRIVAKVDQLMALCDELEVKQQRSRTKLTRLNNAALVRLTSAREADDFDPAWELIRNNFDLLYTTPETIAKLRQSILELAVQGKLIAPTNRDHWKQGVLGDVVESSEAGWSPQCENRPRIGNEWGVLKVSAVSWDHFKPAENKALPPHLDARPEYEVKSGDFLISRANTSELVAKSVVVNDSPHRLSLSDKTVRLHFRADASPRYFCLVNNSPASRDYYAGNAGGTSSSMKNVTRKQILALPVLIPPLSEQHRIVAKVDQLMTLCDGLETRLTKAQAKAEKLTTATIQGLLAA